MKSDYATEMEGLADEFHFEDLYEELERLASSLGICPSTLVKSVTDHVAAEISCKKAREPVPDRYDVVVTHRTGEHYSYSHDWNKAIVMDVDVEFCMGESGNSDDSWTSAYAELKDVRIVGHEPNLIIDRCLARPFGCSFRAEEIAKEAGMSAWKTNNYLEDMARVGGIAMTGRERLSGRSYVVTDQAKLSAQRIIPAARPFAIRKAVKDRLYCGDWEEKAFLYSWRYIDVDGDLAIMEEQDGIHRVSLTGRPGLVSDFSEIRRNALWAASRKLGLKYPAKLKPWRDECVNVPWRKLPRFIKVFKEEQKALTDKYWSDEAKRKRGAY